MSCVAKRVAKLGGSLLKSTNWKSRFLEYLHRCKGEQVVVIVGGGDAVDRIRAQALQENWPDSRSHWLAIQQMDRHARTLAKEFGMTLLEGFPPDEDRPSHAFLCCENWLRMRSANAFAIPESWEVTSDSIALAFALDWGAVQLDLLKSITVGRQQSLEQLSAAGVLDPFFPKLERMGKQRLVEDLVEVRLLNLACDG